VKKEYEQECKELVNDCDIVVDYMPEPYELKWLIMAACVADAYIIFLPCGFFYLSIFLFFRSSP